MIIKRDLKAEIHDLKAEIHDLKVWTKNIAEIQEQLLDKLEYTIEPQYDVKPKYNILLIKKKIEEG